MYILGSRGGGGVDGQKGVLMVNFACMAADNYMFFEILGKRIQKH